MKYEEQLDLSEFVSIDTCENELNQNAIYNLQAIAVHEGTITGGHYVAFVKKED